MWQKYVHKNQAFRILGFLKNTFLLLCGLTLLAIWPQLTLELWGKYQSQHWPTISAQVDDVTLHITDDHRGLLKLSYSYTVQSKLYSRTLEERANKKNKLSEERSSRWKSYLNGSSIYVRYNPAHPETSFLESESVTSIFVVICITGFLLVGGGLIISVAIAGFRER